MIFELPAGPLAVRFGPGTFIKEVKPSSPLAGKVRVGEKVVAVTRPGLPGSVDCADMNAAELSEILVAFKDSAGRTISVKAEGQFQIKIPSGPVGVKFAAGAVSAQHVPVPPPSSALRPARGKAGSRARTG